MHVITSYNKGIGTCVTYLTDSDTSKKCWYWPDTDTDIRNWCSPTSGGCAPQTLCFRDPLLHSAPPLMISWIHHWVIIKPVISDNYKKFRYNHDHLDEDLASYNISKWFLWVWLHFAQGQIKWNVHGSVALKCFKKWFYIAYKIKFSFNSKK